VVFYIIPTPFRGFRAFAKIQSEDSELLPSVDRSLGVTLLFVFLLFFNVLLFFDTFRVAIVSPVGDFHPTGAGRFPTY
jgi:hypothetical protein